MSNPLESEYVLWKTGPAVSDSRIHKAAPDPLVVSDSGAHRLDVHSYEFAYICDLVDKGDLCGQKSIRRVLDHLGGAHIGHYERSFQWRIKFPHNRLGLRTARTDDDAVGVHEVVHRGPFA